MARIISTKEARKILGKGFNELDDNQVEEVIDTLSLIAREMFEKASNGRVTQKHQSGRSNLGNSVENDGRSE